MVERFVNIFIMNKDIFPPTNQKRRIIFILLYVEAKFHSLHIKKTFSLQKAHKRNIKKTFIRLIIMLHFYNCKKIKYRYNGN